MASRSKPSRPREQSFDMDSPPSSTLTPGLDMKLLLEALQDGVHQRVRKKQADALNKIDAHSKQTQARLDRMYNRQEQELQTIFQEFLVEEKTRARRITRLQYELAKNQVELKKIVKGFVETTKQEVEAMEKQDKCILHQIDRLIQHEAEMSRHALRTERRS